MPPIYVINLDRAPDRLAAIAAGLDGFGLSWRRVEAIDRLAVSDDWLTAEFGAGELSRAFPATPGDMACSLSHQALWREIASGEAEAAIVLEDDARLSDAFVRLASADLAGHMRRHGMGALKIEFWPGPQQSRRFPVGQDLGPITGGMRLYRMRSGFLGTCGYVLTADAARQLLRRFPKLGVPVDHFLFGPEAALGFDLLRPGFVNPAPVLHDVARFGSDIGPARSEGKRTIGRRLRDHVARRRLAAETRRGEVERVEMRFAGED
ncbi:glycosyltransferase family 25 protein [Defluviimonas sp. SAOS-178_SWC]|uniref:glycosyltransferase family 25 protein n=1 Tax=Defluviimonas sp. SAOS-178_SWC TaxID=3121287 RepID=UPI003221F1C2